MKLFAPLDSTAFQVNFVKKNGISFAVITIVAQLVAATNFFRLLFWDICIVTSVAQNGHRLNFSPHCFTKTETECEQFSPSCSSPSFASIDRKNAYLIQEHLLASGYNFPSMAVQTDAKTVLLLNESLQRSTFKDVGYKIEQIALEEETLVICGEKEIMVWKIDNDEKGGKMELSETAKFDRNFIDLHIFKHHFVALTEHALNILSNKVLPS